MSAPDELIAGRYRLVRLVGSGGMGAVWEARDERLRLPVALKQLHGQQGVAPADAELANQRAMREARITARLYHRHAVPVFDVVQHEGRPCLIMQFLPSMTLSEILREGGPLLPDEAAKVGAQISSALAAAHAVGIVHRDVKPGNILIADDGNALISDFGISHALGDATLTSTGLVHGTPAFLAPEVARGAESTFASDVFSLGSTLYAATEGSPPFGTDSNTIALLHRVAAGNFPTPQQSGPLTPVLLDMLSVDPETRPSMKEVASRLTKLAIPDSEPPPDLAPVPTVPMQPVRPPPEPPPSKPFLPPAASDESTPRRLTAPTAAELATVQNARPPAAGPPDRPKWAPAIVGVAVLLLVALVAAGIWWTSRDPGTVVAEQEPSTASTAETSESPESTAPSETPAATDSPSPESQPPTSTTPSPTRKPKPTPTRVTGTPTAAQLAEAISSYYALMPDGQDEGWKRLTRSYQRSPSGGRQGYAQFWDPIERVRVSDVTGDPPDEAEATVTYVYKDGRVVRERTGYGLVEDDGVLKINSSQVLGSG